MVGGETRLRKTTWYPRPHESTLSWAMGAENASAQFDTICPLVNYDEGLGDPASYNANPQHASFASTDMPNCYPESRLEKVFCQLDLSLTKGAIETDKIQNLMVCFQPIFTSFLEDITAKDEKTGLTIGTVLELQSESTDRQVFPLYNTVKMAVKYTGSSTLPAAVDGLTTTQLIEGTAFDINTFYDALQYYSNGDKLKTVQGGLNWVMLTRNRPTRKIMLTLRSKNKFMNPYSFFGVRVMVPQCDTPYQIPQAGETTNVAHVYATVRTRYNEWNENFDFARQ